ncbi:MAG: class II aldolase/adducin family protein [Candidatus Melainabacteria bacterium]|nr:class II aldolase/adducin family protein [Candidatus Melainabacteria bacterium]
MSAEKETFIEVKHREDLKKVCNMAYEKGLLSGTEGNLSLKINSNLILVTPRNSHKGSVEINDFVIVDIDGNTISNGKREPTSELALHLEAYKKRPDIRAVVHVHPPTAVAFSVSGLNFNQPAIPEIIVLLGEVPTVPYREPGTVSLAELAGTYLVKNDAIILDHHGAVTLGKDIFDAYFKMESLEHAAKIMHNAYTLGEIKSLDEAAIDELVKQRHKIYGKEVELREGSKLFQSTTQTLKLKNIFKKITESNSPIFQRILNLINELVLTTIQNTSYSQKLSSEEQEQFSRELTASFLSMTLGRFTRK